MKREQVLRIIKLGLRILLLSFAIALCAAMVAPLAEMLTSDGVADSGPEGARTVFTIVFGASLVLLVGRALILGRKSGRKT
jgi:hypothetical protein